MEMAKLVSSWSKDTNTKVGALVVSPDRQTVHGYNGMPRGANDDVLERYQHPIKAFWWEHAERNAIYNATLLGVSLKGWTMYLNGDHGFPCADCARAIIQCGIKAFVGLEPDFTNKYADSYRQTMILFQECGVAFRWRTR